MKIKLTTIQEVQDFVKIANTQLPHRLYASQERYTVDAKSIMGLFSLDLPNPVELYSDEVSDLSVFNNFEYVAKCFEEK